MSYSLLILWAFSQTLSAQSIDELSKRARAGEQKAVLAELDQILTRSPTDYAVAFLKAKLLVAEGQTTIAMEIYRGLIKQSPVRPEAYNNLAMLLAKQGDVLQAQKLLERAMHTDPSYATVYENLSAVYVEMARDSYGKALRLDTPVQILVLKEIEKTPVKNATSSGIINRASPAKAAHTNKKQVIISKDVRQPKSGIDEQEIITTLKGWAAAWSEQDVDVYLVFYDDSYSPPGQPRRVWEAQRRSRIKRPKWIQIGLSDFDIQPINTDIARVRLIQDYKASNYMDRTRKELQLRSTPDGWRIISEHNLSKVN